jgi:hypothetical protein
MASLLSDAGDGNVPLLAPNQVASLDNLNQKDTEKQRLNSTYDNLVHHAAVCVHAGLHGRLHIGLNKDSLALRVAFFYHSSKWRAFYLVVTAFNLSLAFWENDAGEAIKFGSVQFYLLFLELLFLCIYVADLCLLYRYIGKALLKSRWVQLRTIMICVIFIDTVVCIFTPQRVGHYTRFLRPLFLIERLRNVRKIAGAIFESTPKILNVLVLLFFHITFFGVVAFVLFRGVEGTMGDHLHVSDLDRTKCNFLHYDLGEPVSKVVCSTFSKNCKDYFGSFYSSTMQLFILLTTANYPDVMMPVYECQPYTALFFVVYVSIGLYFLMSLVLAVVYSHFADRTRKKFIKHHEKRKKSIDYAFQLLIEAKRLRQSSQSAQNKIGNNISSKQSSNHNNEHMIFSYEELENETIQLPEWVNMLRYLSKKIPPEVAESLFYLRKRKRLRIPRNYINAGEIVHEIEDGEKNLYIEQFRLLVRFSRMRIRRKAAKKSKVTRLKSLQLLATRVSQASMSTRDSIRLRLLAIISTKIWVFGFDALVFINSVILIMVLAPGGHRYHKTLRQISGVFLYIFVVEVVSKIFALSFMKFWRMSKMNQLDFLTVASGVVVNIISIFVNQQNKQAVQFLSICITFIRMIRLLRILRVLSEFRVVTNTIVHVLPALMRYFAVLLGIFYMYAIIGMELFGSRLDVTKLEYPYNVQLNESSYVLNDYQNNNFDSLSNSFVTLFEQMVVNNWPIVMEGCIASTGYWSTLYFISFYLITVVTVMNVLIAFLLDAYQAHKDSFDNQVNINENFAYNSTQGKVAKEPWLKQLEKVSKTRGIDISNYTLQLKSHVGDVYKAMYGDADEVTTESFSSFTDGDSRPSRDSFGFRSRNNSSCDLPGMGRKLSKAEEHDAILASLDNNEGIIDGVFDEIVDSENDDDDYND